MKERGLMMAVSILLVYSAGTLAVMFWVACFSGCPLIEPSISRGLAEISLASLFALVGLAGFIVALWNTLKERRGK